MSGEETATIIGGGIGGLATALALSRAGRPVQIYEKDPHHGVGGAALALGANAMVALNRLGLGESVSQRGQVIEQLDILDARGTTMFGYDTPPELAGKQGVSILREDLHQILKGALPVGAVSSPWTLVDLRPVNRGIRARFTDGTDVLSPLLIGADGMRSRVRLAMHPGIKPVHAGYVCWRGLTDGPVPGVPAHRATETWTPQGRFGVVPLMGGKVYWFACITAKVQDRIYRLWNHDDLKNHFGKFHDPIPAVLSASRPESIHVADIYDIPVPRSFHHGRSVLVGDAAHGTTPNLGQGACQAIEDAIVLADCLTEYKDVDRALAAYTGRRRARAAFISRASRRVGILAQMRNPLLISMRNALLKRVPSFVWKSMTRKVLMTKV